MDTEVPEPMQFEMLADCATAPLPLTTKVETLKTLRLRLCHVMEWEIYKQTKAINTKVVEKEGLFSSMFSRPKCTHHTTLVPFEGDIPFKPHRMLGFNPSMSLRVPAGNTEWSDALDVIKGDFDSSELCITTSAAPALSSSTSSIHNTSSKFNMSKSSTGSLPGAALAAAPAALYEFGAFLERGRGFLHNITTVTLVPKHVIVSRLSMTIQIKQIFPSVDCAPLTLLPGTLCSYHFPTRSRSKLLHIRRAPASAVPVPVNPVLTDPTKDEVVVGEDEEWQAEVDICKLGVLYAKLRNPLQIIKVQIDTVGASMVATLTEQSILWPPYRIDNMTEMEIRFRQITNTTSSSSAAGRKNSVVESSGSKLAVNSETNEMPVSATTNSSTLTGADDAIPPAPVLSATMREVKSMVDLSASTTRSNNDIVPWDHLEKHNSAAYAWDLPFSGKKTVELEVRQLSSSWVRCEVNLDDDDKPASVIVKKTAPSLGNPFAEGFLMRQDATGDNWTRVYCILRPDVLYIYPDETRDFLIEVINFSQNGTGEPQFAAVSKLADKKKPSTMGYLSSVIGSSNANKSKLADINRARCLILKIADDMGLFANITLQSFKRRNRGDSSEGEEEETTSAVEATSTAESVIAQPELVVLYHDIADDKAGDDGGTVTFESDLPADATEEVTLRDEILELLEKRQTITDIPNMFAPVCVEPGEEADLPLQTAQNEEPSSARSSDSKSMSEGESPLRKARFSSAPGSTLASLLAAGASTEELLEEASSVALRVADVVESLLSTKQADRLDKAKEMVEWMLTEGLLMPRSASKAISGPSTVDAADRDDRDFAADREGLTDFAPDLDVDEDPEEAADRFTMTLPHSRSALAMATGVLSFEETSRDSFGGLPEGTSRISFSRSVTMPTTRSSLTAEDLFAEPGGNRRSMATLSRKKNTLYKLFENVDLFMCPPALNPEMMAMLEQINQQDAEDLPPSAASSAGAHAFNNTEAEIFGFTIAMETKKYNFKCSSEMEFFGWIQACRQSIELLWVDHLLGRLADKKAVKLEDYQASILLRLRADGSTKVLEVIQDDGNVGKGAKGKFLRRNKAQRRGSVSSAEAVGKLSRFIRNSHLSLGLGSEHKSKEFNREKELISVLFSVQSIALSVINSEPSELLYLSFHGNEITVERSLDLVKFSVTVQEIQISNQLLNPEFPVALFPRRIKEGLSGRLMLPGLNPDRTTFPSLHLYFQQRYHQSINDVGSASDSFEDDSQLHYFEMFTLWLSPLQLDVDEEIIVKCIRYIRGFKDVVYNPNLGRTELKEDIMNLQLLGSKSWEGHVDRRAVFEVYLKFLDAGKEPYMTYNPSAKSKTGIYFSLLQLHPVDLVMSFRPSPNLVVTNSELAMISIISQLDSARLCLNALIAEHAFGSPAIMGEILVKHYKAAFWRQFHKLIGSSDIVEGSVGLVANLGSGVYDLFYEPIDGLLDENGSFLNGLSKGGISLASRTIGGTSAFTSQITGGLGKGVSFLTLDSQFQRNRAYRRFNKTSTVSEGLYVGTQELGKNIAEGVTGIVLSPYRGWETGGGVGFGMGIAKGILGVALKPAVGVLDFASRATEGLRNTAFNNHDVEDRYGIHRKRIPRAFGRNGQIALYDARAAAAQYVADSLTFFKPEPRLQVVHHLYIRRKLERFRIPGAPVSTETAEELARDATLREAWGMALNRSYVVLVGHNRVALAELATPEKPAAGMTKKTTRRRAVKPRKFIWSCPANCIEQLFSDPRGDLILSIGNSTLISGTWNNACPVVVDNFAQNYVIFQSLLEQTIGPKRARNQPFVPTEGMIQGDIRKRYSTGLKSFLMSPTNHTYRLFGNVLYEYSDGASKKQAAKAEAGGATTTATAANSGNDADKTTDTAVEPVASKSEFFIDQMISRIFPTDVSPATAAAAAPTTKPLKTGDPSVDDMYLSFVYPLVDLYIAGPVQEDNGRSFSITLSRLDGQKMRVLKAEEEQEHLSEYLKNSLSLIFTRQEEAYHWKRQLDTQMLWNLDADELVEAGPLTVEERRKQGRSLMTMARGAEELVIPEMNSILGMLVLPTSGCKSEQTETIKIEIAKTLSSTRWR